MKEEEENTVFVNHHPVACIVADTSIHDFLSWESLQLETRSRCLVQFSFVFSLQRHQPSCFSYPARNYCSFFSMLFPVLIVMTLKKYCTNVFKWFTTDFLKGEITFSKHIKNGNQEKWVLHSKNSSPDNYIWPTFSGIRSTKYHIDLYNGPI